MTQANDSIVVTPGSGATVATHVVNGKEHQVVMLADPYGHVFYSRDTYVLYAPPVSAVGASKLHFDVWLNGIGKKMLVHRLRFFSDLDVAVTGVLAARIDVFRSTAIGTGGTAFSIEATTAARTLARIDPGMTAVPAGLTAREAPTGGATAGVFLGSMYTQPEETATSMGYLTAALGNHPALLEGRYDVPDIVVPDNTGLRIVQGPVASVGKVGMTMVFALV